MDFQPTRLLRAVSAALIVVTAGVACSGPPAALPASAPQEHAQDGWPVYATRFVELLLSMRWDDPQVRPLLELEGLSEWLPGRTSGYAQLELGVNEAGFYSADGRVLDADYRY